MLASRRYEIRTDEISTPALDEITKGAGCAAPCLDWKRFKLLLVGRASGLGSAVHTEFMRRRNVRRLGIQQALMIGSQAQFDQRPRVRRQLGLPAIGRLVAGHGVAGGLVPSAGGPAGKVMLPNEGALDLQGALLVDPALTVGTRSTRLGFARMMGG